MTTKRTGLVAATQEPAQESTAGALLPLSRPISDGAQIWNELTIKEPTLADHIMSDQKPEGMAQVIALYAIVSGVPEEAIRRMKTQDSRKLQAIIEQRAEDAPEPITEADGATFTLLHPIDAGGRKVTTITLREPDLEAGIAIEKVKGGPNQVTAASIAVLSGLTIPVIAKLQMKDVWRMEEWLLPFLNDTDPMPDGEI
ncbi:phage tail assembly protein [Hyphomicrobium sp. 802]|uniref:phage tail assembly protein n=1 Tax=unclassified Hyphomicrobium TaxID=2619925 RepID=UPI00045E8B83|nr:phage tail assembly protein [Hyphomicrobium sp. 802]